MEGKIRLAVFGQKRLSREGGIEIVVKELCTRMAQNGCEVTCYNRAGHHVSGAEYDKTIEYDGIRQKVVPTIEKKGYVGLSLAVLLAQHHQVTALDIVPEKVEMINNKKSPIRDEYIEKYLAEKELDLTATLDAKEAYSDADFVVIAAPTNYDSKKNFFDTSAVEAVIKLVLHVTTTPSVAYIARVDDFDCGIMISASHNPYYDNGIKLIDCYGEKMPEETLLLVEDYIDGKLHVFDKDWPELPFAHREHIGCTVDYVAGRNRYMGYLISLGIYSFKGVKVGLDCANGSSWNIAKSVFDALGADTYVINNKPNGLNINNNAGSTHIEGLQKFVVEKGLDVGFAYDGDADRCLCVDEKWSSSWWTTIIRSTTSALSMPLPRRWFVCAVPMRLS